MTVESSVGFEDLMFRLPVGMGLLLAALGVLQVALGLESFADVAAWDKMSSCIAVVVVVLPVTMNQASKNIQHKNILILSCISVINSDCDNVAL